MHDLRYYISIIQESYTYNNSPEEWVRSTIQGEKVNVYWQKDKNQKNIQKHKYSLDAAIHALNDPNAVRIMDDMGNEYRQTTLCRGADGNILFVVWSWLDTGEEITTIRIISVRKADPDQVTKYVNSMTTNPKNITEHQDISEDEIPWDPDVKVEPFAPWFKNMIQRRKQSAATKKE